MKIEQWDIKKIIPYDRNPRNNENAVDNVAMSIEQYGWQQPIVVDKFGVVLVGHTRLKAAKQLGMSTCPVRVAEDLSESKAKAYRIMDNKSAEFSEWDQDLLGIEIQELVDLDFDIELTGFDFDDFDIQTPDSQPLSENDQGNPDRIKPKDVMPIKKFGVNKTRSAYFFSIRRWSTVNKKEQIHHIQEMKKEINEDFIDKVVNDFEEFFSIFNNVSDCLISHAPAGNSVNNKFNLATEITKKLSLKLGIEYCKLFSDFPKKTKEVGNYKNKQDTKLINNIPAGSQVILIDDVATTGTTMETCISLLKDFQIIPVVWVYSEVVNNE